MKAVMFSGACSERPCRLEMIIIRRRNVMLVLSRRRNESIVVGDDIEIVVVEIRPDRVRLAVKGPGVSSAHRREPPSALVSQRPTRSWS